MTTVLDIERAAARLRNQLRLATLPEVKFLCGLRFFGLFAPDKATGLESYEREFMPALAQAARKSNPREFLPEETAALAYLIALLEAQGAAVQPDDFAALGELHANLAAVGRAPWGSTNDTHDASSKENGRPSSPLRATVAGAPPRSAVASGGLTRRTDGSSPRTSAAATCLFVEYYPDLDLPPRGRCLTLNVTATPISNKVEADDIVVRNPVSEPDDRFLSQARDSVAAARAHLAQRYGLSLRKRYRFDFAVNSTGARFTGDSLGVAFALGAMAAIGKIEVFREKLSLRTDVAFSGALSADGRLAPIDPDALKLKIYRAFHSGLRFLVIPRAHITDAWAYLKELETNSPHPNPHPNPLPSGEGARHDTPTNSLPPGERAERDTPTASGGSANPLPPGEGARRAGEGEQKETVGVSPATESIPREGAGLGVNSVEGRTINSVEGPRLELVGADHLDTVATDPRLLPTERSSAPAYAVRKAWKAKRSAWVEVPVMLGLLYALTCVIFPKARCWFDWKPSKVTVTESGFQVANRDGHFLWEKTFDSEFDALHSVCRVEDIDGDGMPEVAFMPAADKGPFQEQNSVFVFGTAKVWMFSHPELRFSRICTIDGKYPGEEPNQPYWPQLEIVDTGGGIILITGCMRSEPARNHLRMWSSTGDSLGWYINSGACGFRLAIDFNGDGRRELFFTPLNNRVDPKSCCLLVLPLTGSRGVSPPYDAGPEYDLSSVERGNQLTYMLFPPTDIARESKDPYNDVTALRAEGNGMLLLATWETDQQPVRGMRYFIRSDFRVDHVSADDVFMRVRAIGDPVAGMEPVTDWDAYFGACLQAVTYWAGSGWVTEGQLRAAEKSR
jgi:hypothetical protein